MTSANMIYFISIVIIILLIFMLKDWNNRKKKNEDIEKAAEEIMQKILNDETYYKVKRHRVSQNKKELSSIW